MTVPVTGEMIALGATIVTTAGGLAVAYVKARERSLARHQAAALAAQKAKDDAAAELQRSQAAALAMMVKDQASSRGAFLAALERNERRDMQRLKDTEQAHERITNQMMDALEKIEEKCHERTDALERTVMRLLGQEKTDTGSFRPRLHEGGAAKMGSGPSDAGAEPREAQEG